MHRAGRWGAWQGIWPAPKKVVAAAAEILCCGACVRARKKISSRKISTSRAAPTGATIAARAGFSAARTRAKQIFGHENFSRGQNFWGASPNFFDEPKISRGPRRAHRRDRGARATTARAPLMFFALLRKFSQKLFSFPLELFLPRTPALFFD